MRTIARVALFIAAINLGVLPVSATWDPNTGDLVRTIEKHGYTVAIEKCDRGIMGWMNARMRKMVICNSADLSDDNTHDTVRHEGWHIVQACISGPDSLDPVLTKRDDFVEFVESGLPQETIDMVIRTYPRDRHAIELEAWTAARVLTADQVITALNTHC